MYCNLLLQCIATMYCYLLLLPRLLQDRVIAVTARVGRAMEGIVQRMAPFLLNAAETTSLLLIGRPGVCVLGVS